MIRWYLCSTAPANYRSLLSKARKLQRRKLPDNIISAAPSLDGTKVALKVAGLEEADDREIQSTFGGVIKAVYTESTHDKLLSLMQGPEWKESK